MIILRANLTCPQSRQAVIANYLGVCEELAVKKRMRLRRVRFEFSAINLRAVIKTLMGSYNKFELDSAYVQK